MHKGPCGAPLLEALELRRYPRARDLAILADNAGFPAYQTRTPLGRLATAEDIAAAVVWLASEDARSI